MSTQLILFLANAAAATVVAYVCFCRLNATSRYTRPLVRLKYVLLMVSALVVGGLPIFFQVQQNWMMFIGLMFVLVLVCMEVRFWRYGPPACTYKRCQ